MKLGFRFFFHFRVQILIIIAVGIAASLMEAAGVTLFIPILQGVSGSVDPPFPINHVIGLFAGLTLAQRLRVVSGLLVVVYTLKGALIYLNGVQSAKLEADGTNYQIIRCYRGILGAEISYINGQSGSHLYSILRQHVGRFGQILRAVAESVPQFFMFATLLAMLLVVSWKMTLLAGAFAALSSVLIQGLQKRAVATGKAITKSVSKLDATVLDTLSGLKTIHLFVRADDMVKRFSADIEDWGRRLVNVARVQSATAPFFESSSVIGLSLLLVFGSFILSDQGTRTVQFDVLVTFLIVFYRMLPTVAALNRTRVSIGSMLPVCHEVQGFLEEVGRHQVVNGTRVWQGLQRSIEFRQVSFRYGGRETALDRVSLEIPRGVKVGIVGASGAGKSTIGELLLHFYDPQEGAILVDGIDLREIDLASWRRRIGVVTQETFLFNDTIAGNIRFAMPEATQAQVEIAARRAHIHDFIVQLPQGYNTVTGDRGVLLSGGQRQRLAIARAILAEPEILVLDEATSALDSESEQLVQEALDEISEGRTVIAIAHRLSTVANADVLVVLSGGRVVEYGTHAELCALPGGIYRRLADMQSFLPGGNPAVQSAETSTH